MSLDRYSGSNDDAPLTCDAYCPGCTDCREPICEECDVGGDLVEVRYQLASGRTQHVALCPDCAAEDVGAIWHYSTPTTDDAAPVEAIEDETTPLPAMSMAALVFGEVE